MAPVGVVMTVIPSAYEATVGASYTCGSLLVKKCDSAAQFRRSQRTSILESTDGRTTSRGVFKRRSAAGSDTVASVDGLIDSEWVERVATLERPGSREVRLQSRRASRRQRSRSVSPRNGVLTNVAR